MNSNRVWVAVDRKPLDAFAPGDEVAGKVTHVTGSGIFVSFGAVKDGFLQRTDHHTEVGLQAGDRVEGLTISYLDAERGRVSLQRAGAGVPGGARASEQPPRGRPPGAGAAESDGWSDWTNMERASFYPAKASDVRQESRWHHQDWDRGWAESHNRKQNGWSEWDCSKEAWWQSSWQQSTNGWKEGIKNPEAAELETSSSAKESASHTAEYLARDKGLAAQPVLPTRPAPPPVPTRPQTREQLKAAVFKLFDVDADGWLNSSELREFACQTGFDGCDSEWAEEYRMFCDEVKADPSQGIAWKDFATLLEDESESGCHTTDEELREMLGVPADSSRQAPPTAVVSSTPAAAAVVASAPPPSAVVASGAPPAAVASAPTAAAVASPRKAGAAIAASPEPTPPKSRSELKVAVFAWLDIDRNRYLREHELRTFAQQTGFDGTNEEWAEEYVSLCAAIGCDTKVGLDFESFATMVDDRSEDGCYCTDEELAAMLKGVQPATPAAAAPPGPVPAVPQAIKTSADPWEENADPWAASQKGDPWAAAASSKPKKGTAASGDRAPHTGARAPQNGDRAPHTGDRAVEKADDTWENWREAEPSKPALDAQKLLEASRAALEARRKAKELKEAAEAKAREELEAKEAARAQEALLQVESALVTGGSASSSSSSRPKPRAVSMPAALGEVGRSVAQLAMGSREAVFDLLEAVTGAPCLAHALAVACSAVRSLLQGRVEEARTLLALKELILVPAEGDAALLRGLVRLAGSFGAQGMPFAIRALLAALVKVDDKQPTVRSAAEAATEEIFRCSDPFGFEGLLPVLTAALDPKRSPAMKLHALKLLAICWRGRDGEAAVANRLEQLLPAACALLVDSSPEVRSAAGNTAEVLLNFCGNCDLQAHLPSVLACARGTRDVAQCVQELAEVVFVQQVEAPALAVVMPVLVKALRSRVQKTQRQACIVAENMCRLVSMSADVQPIVPHLLPILLRISEEASDEGVRAVAGRAHNSLKRVAEADEYTGVQREFRDALEMADSTAEAVAARSGDAFTPCPAPVRSVILDYAVMLCVCLGRYSVRSEAKWSEHLLPVLRPLLGYSNTGTRELISRLCKIGSRLAMWGKGEEQSPKAQDVDQEEEDAGEAVPVCDCTFTLACGAATLLVGARLRLLPGRVYGLWGANDSGKSTLLRAIHERKVVGFPPSNRLVTALVEHGVVEKPSEAEQSPVEHLAAMPAFKARGMGKSELRSALRSMGFDEAGMLERPIRTLSGGWRMKLSLASAMLQEADVMLFDEPTGHLDAEHIAWLVAYIHALQSSSEKPVTVLIVSHDTSFLDSVCTDIIHLNDGKLQNFAGSFASFAEGVLGGAVPKGPHLEEEGTSLPGKLEPSATSAAITAFSLPQPKALEAVRSRGRRVLCLEEVFFSYPGNPKPAVRGASVECSLQSRVAIVGPNGAGKSTLAELVVGELAPDAGVAWRHPNLRVAFVAQHAFHHLEQHMDMTATQYIIWRFEGNEDREAADLRAQEAEVAEPRAFKLLDERLVPCDAGDPNVAEAEVVVDRRQRGRLGYEYEVRWRGRTTTTWLLRHQLAAMGCLGMAKREDERQAAQRALSDRPLTTPSVEAHLAGFGLGAEEASHRRLGALSHGQRARVVLAAATWFSPHLLVLDEPTNYMDRPGLSALSAGLKSFGGGVLLISHTRTFLEEVCNERWNMKDGQLFREGEAPPEATPEGQPVVNGAGGARAASAKEILQKKLAEAKEKKRLKRLKELRRKNGEQVSSGDEEWWDDLLKKANPKSMGS